MKEPGRAVLRGRTLHAEGPADRQAGWEQPPATEEQQGSRGLRRLSVGALIGHGVETRFPVRPLPALGFEDSSGQPCQVQPASQPLPEGPAWSALRTFSWSSQGPGEEGPSIPIPHRGKLRLREARSSHLPKVTQSGKELDVNPGLSDQQS